MPGLLEQIEQLEQALENEALLIEAYLSEGTDYNSEVFDKPVTIKLDDDDTNILNHISRLTSLRGIYAFVTVSGFDFDMDARLKWNECNGAPARHRDSETDHISKGQVFYIGASSKDSLGERIKKHCTMATNAPTASLKLQYPTRKWVRPYLKVICFPIKIAVSDHARHMVLSFVERLLHEHYEPVVGSRRV